MTLHPTLQKPPGASPSSSTPGGIASNPPPISVNGSNTSSSAVSSAEGKGQMVDTTNSPESLQEFLKSFPKKDLVRSSFDKEKKQFGPSRCKMTESNKGIKGCGNLELKKTSSNSSAFTQGQTSKKLPRKVEHPNTVPSPNQESPDFVAAKTLICKNTACKAVLAIEDTFCKRCSCCICHMFDHNKDPSLWLVCSSEHGNTDACGLSCRIECALQQQKVGVINLGRHMQLDGRYCCASCGKISSIIQFWKKQLMIAKDARRLDVLCYRIALSYRILEGTAHFTELHDIVSEAKLKLETEVGEITGVSSKMARGIVSRLSISADVQKLCCLAIDKADEWLNSVAQSKPDNREGSLPAACKFQFVDVTSSSVVIVLKETCSSSCNTIQGYKLWYGKSRDKSLEREPVVFPKSRRRIFISNLQPCTEYTFRIISFTDKGDLGHSEAKCFTRSVDIIPKSSENLGVNDGFSLGKRRTKPHPSCSSGFRVRDLGKILCVAWAEEHGGIDGFYNDSMEEESCDGDGSPNCQTAEEGICEFVLRSHQFVPHGLDLKVVSVPDLNAEITPLSGCSPDEDKGCTSEKKRSTGSNGTGDSLTWADMPAGEVPAVESHSDLCRNHAMTMNDEGVSTLVNCTPLRVLNGSIGKLDDNYEYCVKVIRWLECRGYIEKDFRLKFLTWFSLRSSEQERRVVHTFINTLIDEPNSLAGQLADSFMEIIHCKRPRNGFCSKLWH